MKLFTPLISVIIPHYNDVTALAKCLASVRAQSIDPSLYEVIICDNNSPKDAQQMLNELRHDYSSYRFITEGKKGAAHARNAAMRLATGDIIAFIDCDCVADKNWLENAMTSLHQGADMVGGEVAVSVKDETAPTGVEAFEQVFGFRQKMYVEKHHFSVTANLVCTRQVMERVGDFIHGVSEDKDWCLRAKTNGFHLIYNKESLVVHPARYDWSSLIKKWQRLIEESFSLGLNNTKSNNFSHYLKWVVNINIIYLSCFVHVLPIFMHKNLIKSKSRLKAVKTLFSIRHWRAVQMWQLLKNNNPAS